MAHKFETKQEIQDALPRIDSCAKTVTIATTNRFAEPYSDIYLAPLAEYVSALKAYLERVFEDAFGDDGPALLDGTHTQSDELAELSNDLLDQHEVAWLPPRISELEGLVNRATTVLMEAPIVPVTDDHPLAAELQQVLANELAGRFVSLYCEPCCLRGECRTCCERAEWERLVRRMRRNLDRRDPEAAQARQEARRAATQHDVDAETQYLEADE